MASISTPLIDTPLLSPASDDSSSSRDDSLLSPASDDSSSSRDNSIDDTTSVETFSTRKPQPLDNDKETQTSKTFDDSSSFSRGRFYSELGTASTINRPIVQLFQEASFPRKVSWNELFFDLTFVCALANCGEALIVQNESDTDKVGDGVVHGLTTIVMVFVPVWQFWVQVVSLMNHFGASQEHLLVDDYSEAVFYAAAMGLMACLNMNIPTTILYKSSIGETMTLLHVQEPDDNKMPIEVDYRKYADESLGFHVTYCVLRVLLVAMFLGKARLHKRYIVYSEQHRMCLWTAGCNATVALLWVGVILSPTYGWHNAAWSAALFVDCLSYARACPLLVEHFAERFGLFVVIAMGEVFVGCSREHEDLGITERSYFYVVRGFTIMMVYMLKLIYFDAMISEERQFESEHPAKRDGLRCFLWASLHCPMALAMVVMGAGVSSGFSDLNMTVLQCDAHNYCIVVFLASSGGIFWLYDNKRTKAKRLRVGSRMVAAAVIAAYAEWLHWGYFIAKGNISLHKYVNTCLYAPILVGVGCVVLCDVYISTLAVA